jgi:hypothetical protein
VASPKPEDRRPSSSAAPPSPLRGPIESPDITASSSSSSSSLSDTDHPAHRSQLFKRPPRFKQQRPRDLSTFEEGDGAHDGDDSGSHGSPNLPFASAARQPANTKYAHDIRYKTNSKSEQKVLQIDRTRDIPLVRQRSVDTQSQTVTEAATSSTNSASESDAPAPPSATKGPMSPVSNHRTELGRLGSPRQRGRRKEGSEGTPSMGSSFSDIDGNSNAPHQFVSKLTQLDAGISQSALEEALLSNMQHGRMSTLSRMSRYL